MIRNFIFTIYTKFKDVFILLFKFTLQFIGALSVLFILWLGCPPLYGPAPDFIPFVFYFSSNCLIWLFIFDRKFSDIKALEIAQKLLFFVIFIYLAVFLIVFLLDRILNQINF